ncbi:hypothetical protein Moror_3715 [Moniliophthora roreri MCA 2997]|uniref:Uncharacterized protein n=1 Tax=Moniliophthora roreri (strain MCA 2997) TaxID=1381753 RepID=V2WLF3_MONRO|nr:hypothetical protein Moror_3715 [Moniliophthora roreri MCA 2997]
MTKPKPGNPGRGCDQKWDEGPKSEYLNSLESLWRQKSTLFLDEVEKYFVKTWGYNLPVYDIPDENTDYAPPDINTFPEDQCQEEADLISVKITLLTLSLQKASNWAYYCWGDKSSKQKKKVQDKNTVVNNCLRELGNLNKKTLKIQDEFAEYWNVVGEAEGSNRNWLHMMNAFTRRKMDKEGPKVIADLQKLNSNQYKAEMTKYEADIKWTSTLEEFARDGLEILAPLADATAMVFGGIVTVCVTLPRPKDGKIETRSITSVVPCSNTTIPFQNWDEAGYKRLHYLCNFYGQAIFTKEECKRQIVLNDSSPSGSNADCEEEDEDVTDEMLPPHLAHSDAMPFQGAANPIIWSSLSTVGPIPDPLATAGPVTGPDPSGSILVTCVASLVQPTVHNPSSVNTPQTHPEHSELVLSSRAIAHNGPVVLSPSTSSLSTSPPTPVPPTPALPTPALPIPALSTSSPSAPALPTPAPPTSTIQGSSLKELPLTLPIEKGSHSPTPPTITTTPINSTEPDQNTPGTSPINAPSATTIGAPEVIEQQGSSGSAAMSSPTPSAIDLHISRVNGQLHPFTVAPQWLHTNSSGSMYHPQSLPQPSAPILNPQQLLFQQQQQLQLQQLVLQQQQQGFGVGMPFIGSQTPVCYPGMSPHLVWFYSQSLFLDQQMVNWNPTDSSLMSGPVGNRNGEGKGYVEMFNGPEGGYLPMPDMDTNLLQDGAANDGILNSFQSPNIDTRHRSFVPFRLGHS